MAQIKSRWKEHFDELYNVKITADKTVLLDLLLSHESDPMYVETDTIGLLREELEWAIHSSKTGKFPGVNNITADEIRAAGGFGVDVFFKLLTRIWNSELIPNEWSGSIIVPIFKKKDKTLCDNYRGINLLCHAEKLFASIILQPLRKRTEEILSKSPAGFRRGRSTIEQLFALRLLAEKYTEHSRSLYLCYVNYQKAFDSVWRTGLWHVMQHLGYPNKLIRLLKILYEETFSAVRVGRDCTEWFKTVGV